MSTKKTREDEVAAQPERATIDSYRALLVERANAYAEHVAAMTIDPAITSWVERMTQRYGPTVKVWHQTLPWVEALMVVRYGEAVEHWPGEMTNADLGRASDWEHGREEPEAVARARTMTLEGA